MAVKSLEQSIVNAMDGTNVDLFPFLPYILQDIWEIGTDPEIIIELIEKHKPVKRNLNILDLGCGKGAVSIMIAKKMGCRCTGIDGMEEFIADAHRKAREHGVDHLCAFEIGDIRHRIRSLPAYEIIILGSIGPVFGNYYDTLSALNKNLLTGGFIIIDDGYIEDESEFVHPAIAPRKDVFGQIEKAGMVLVDELIIGPDTIKDSDDFIFERIKDRCNELLGKYPEKKNLFEEYVRVQEVENDVLENKVICSVMVLGRALT
jgi:SAM-dependent methyltransferase